MTTQDEQQKWPSPVHMSPQSHGACAAAAASAIASPTKCALRGFPSHMLIAACACMPIHSNARVLSLQSSVPCCTVATAQRSDTKKCIVSRPDLLQSPAYMHPPLVPVGPGCSPQVQHRKRTGSKCASGKHVQRGEVEVWGRQRTQGRAFLASTEIKGKPGRQVAAAAGVEMWCQLTARVLHQSKSKSFSDDKAPQRLLLFMGEVNNWFISAPPRLLLLMGEVHNWTFSLCKLCCISIRDQCPTSTYVHESPLRQR